MFIYMYVYIGESVPEKKCCRSTFQGEATSLHQSSLNLDPTITYFPMDTAFAFELHKSKIYLY